jgi:phospholipid/cholesterol/gamma-HCH transport system permease protein
LIGSSAVSTHVQPDVIMQGAPSKSSSPALAIAGEGDRAVLDGVLGLRTLAQARQALEHWRRQRKAHVLDLSKLTGLDTPGAMFLCELRDQHVELAGVQPEHAALLELIGGLERKPLSKLPAVARWRQLVVQLGKGADDFWRDSIDIITFVGRTFSALGHGMLHPSSLRPASISRQISETGINALPIVGLMAVMISIVIGYQGLAQLRPLGGEDFTINLVAISVIREMGVLITAIMVAGRSGSAFTAEIGVMKAREEIDALDALGLRPFDLLVLPRMIGLIVTLPLLTFFADVMGLLGGGIMAQSLLHVAPPQYLDRVRSSVEMHDVFVGLIKAPVFAFFIATVGCMHGLRVRGSATSVGRETTRAVVKAIFLVIVFDALFSVFFDKVGL